MIDCDVLIVGGGPSGSSLAWALRDSGLDVQLLDKHVFPRDKVCAGWITPEVVSTLRLNLADYAVGRTLQPFHGFRVSRLGGREVHTKDSATPVSFGIRRCEFDYYLLQRSDVTYHECVSVKQLVRDDSGYVIGKRFHTRLLVGAGGHFCPVARSLGAKPGGEETAVVAQETEFLMSPAQAAACKVDARFPELFFCEDLAGYGWVVRKGDYLNVGLGREDKHHLAEHMQSFCEFLKARGKVPYDMGRKFPGHAYLLYPHATRRVVDDHVLLIGDAAGLAYPQSGEGIRPGIESALLAAQIIRRCQGDYSSAALSRYEHRLEERLGRRSQKSVSERLPGWITAFVGSKLLSTRWFVQNIVLNRWFLHAHQPPLTVE